ncbi:uncharacterized protein BJ171DRAFT_578788 [Polychytrium aggregatum]|uniref:uncharacterized protein n=1 Tax=Polychytrium aggregatum TaxID=110093 RepID=UPI0022FEA364|nr:uncharacterized protein BJ171DRAFT_578788 [Polychytrium aggregatum]KAI9207682.1 hypothetical protein BJ171DRAFT_578788 [Polychytrium aggregatum]
MSAIAALSFSGIVYAEPGQRFEFCPNIPHVLGHVGSWNLTAVDGTVRPPGWIDFDRRTGCIHGQPSPDAVPTQLFLLAPMGSAGLFATQVTLCLGHSCPPSIPTLTRLQRTGIYIQDCGYSPPPMAIVGRQWNYTFPRNVVFGNALVYTVRISPADSWIRVSSLFFSGVPRKTGWSNVEVLVQDAANASARLLLAVQAIGVDSRPPGTLSRSSAKPAGTQPANPNPLQHPGTSVTVSAFVSASPSAVAPPDVDHSNMDQGLDDSHLIVVVAVLSLLIAAALILTPWEHALAEHRLSPFYPPAVDTYRRPVSRSDPAPSLSSVRYRSRPISQWMILPSSATDSHSNWRDSETTGLAGYLEDSCSSLYTQE